MKTITKPLLWIIVRDENETPLHQFAQDLKERVKKHIGNLIKKSHEETGC
jgi:hypothetical protein